MTECRVVPIRKHSGHPPSLLAQASVPHRIHAAVNSVEVTRLDSAGHGPLGDAGGDQLGKQGNTVLAGRDARDLPIAVPIGAFQTHTV